MKKNVILMVFLISSGLNVYAADGDLVVGGDINVTGKLEVDGAVTVGDTTGEKAGTIRWHDNHFQGYTGSVWKNLDEASPDPDAVSPLLNVPASRIILEWEHELGEVPQKYEIWAECVQAEEGYAVGDRVNVGAFRGLSGTSYVGTWATSTHVGLQYRTGIYQISRSDHGLLYINDPHWKLQMKAWR